MVQILLQEYFFPFFTPSYTLNYFNQISMV
jgi:hypothetical protein